MEYIIDEVDYYTAEVLKAAADKGFTIEVLGKTIVGDQLHLLQYKCGIDGAKNLLITAGFHGTEPAGPYGVLAWLQQDDLILKNVNLSIIPLVNPDGLRSYSRFNSKGEIINAGFVHQEKTNEKLSEEGHILMKHLDKLVQSAHDGFITLHEDDRSTGYYLYVFEDSTPSPLCLRLLDAGLTYFNIEPDCIKEMTVKDGMVYMHHDGSFEDLLYYKGIPFTATIETPSIYNLDRRINAMKNIINTFINY